MGECVHGMTLKQFQSLLDLANREWHQNLRNTSPIINSEQPASDDINARTQLILAHCFQRFKRKDFHLPVSRRRIFILPQKEDALSPPPKPQPQPPPEPIRCYEEIFKVTQEQPEDVSTWVSQRMHFRRELETLGDLQKWLMNKNEITDLEVKALHRFQMGSQAWLKEHQMLMAHKVSGPVGQLRIWRRLEKFMMEEKAPTPAPTFAPALLPTPTMLHNLFTFLYFHKLKILEIFSRSHFSSNHKITREEFMQTLKKVQFPLNQQDMEDMVIYLSSLSKKNIITLNNLETCYKEWVVSRRKQPADVERVLWLSQAASLEGKSPPGVLHKEVLDDHAQGVHVAHHEFEESKAAAVPQEKATDQESKAELPRSPQRPGGPDHCLPSTIDGEMKDFINHFRQKNFLVYLQCCKICELYDVPLTKDLLVKDKVFQKDQEHHIRQPGGYYNANMWGQKYARTKAKMKDKKMTQKTKELPFEEFEVFLSEQKTKRSDVTQQTDPNFFWPGHLLDKLQLYLPIMKRDRSLALFSSVCPQPPAYPATYHPDRWWPIGPYVTYANYDANKVYYID